MLISRQFAYRGVDLVVIPQPDGSVACIPTWMTHKSAARRQVCAEPQFSLDIFRSLRSEIDALLSFLQPDTKVEKAHDDAKTRKSPTGPVRAGRAAAVLAPAQKIQLAALIEALLLEIAAALAGGEVGDDQDHG